VANIQIRSEEYLPANLECGVFLIPSRALPEETPPFEYGYGYPYGTGGHPRIGIGIELI
jgi:hypothetical protein